MDTATETDAAAAAIAALEARRHRLTEPDPAAVRGLWDDETDLYARYRVALTFTDRVMGGIPQKPDLIASWLLHRTGVDDDHELRLMLRRTLLDLGVEIPELATIEELADAAKRVGIERHCNTFKRDAAGLYLEARQVKAMLKEATNVLYAGTRWGVTKKGPKSALAEWVFVDEARVHLGRAEPDGTFTMHGVVSGAKGSRPTLTQYDFCRQPAIAFTVLSLEDRIEPKQWKAILTHGQLLGLGALRSQGFGQFKITAFDRIEQA